jgi:uncharacterized membrane protein YuzA (DUF378 family)
MGCLRFLVKLLLIVGALNWGLVGFFQYDVVADFLGGMSSGGARFVYALIGLAGLFKVICIFCGRSCCKCGPNCGCGCSKKNNHPHQQ